jgi:dihydrodipicolinate synthase/N-acetylneuraminate lyase
MTTLRGGTIQSRRGYAVVGRFYEGGAHGVYVYGSPGEGWLQAIAQCQAVTEAAVQHSPAGKQLVVRAGAYVTTDRRRQRHWQLLQRHACTLRSAWAQAQARVVQERITELITIGLRYLVVPAVKVLLRRQGIDYGPRLVLRRNLTAAEEADLDEQLAQSGFSALTH